MSVTWFTSQLPSHAEGLAKVVIEQFNMAFAGETDAFFLGYDLYVDRLPEYKSFLMGLAERDIAGRAKAHEWKGDYNDIIAGLTPDYLVTYQALCDYIVVGIDLETPGTPTALYTRSEEILLGLAKQGMIASEDNLKKALDVLRGNKTRLSLINNNFSTVRLDLDTMTSGKPTFKLTAPRSNLTIGTGKQFAIVPLPFYFLFEWVLTAKVTDMPFRFVKSTIIGQVEHKATLSPETVKRIYNRSSQASVISKIGKVRPGYDWLTRRFYAYDLESSVNSIGVASFRPEMLDQLHPVRDNEIDTSAHHVDFQILRGVFRTKIKEARSADLDRLGYLDLTGFANMNDKVGALIEAADRESDRNLYWLMKNNGWLFGDIDKAIETRLRVSPKFMKQFEPVTPPPNIAQQVEVIKSLLEKGVVRFTVRSKVGHLYERTGSNNYKVLQRMLGKDYVKNFETPRVKLYYLRRLLTSGEIKTREELEQFGVEYNILDYVDHGLYFSDKLAHGDVSDTLQTVNDAIETLKQQYAERKYNPYSVRFRNIFAEDSKTFYGNFDVSNLVFVEFAAID